MIGGGVDGILAGRDRRIRPRVPISEPVELKLEDWSVGALATALNLSSGGLFVSGCPLADVGEHVNCRLLFTPREPIAVDCRVAWVRQSAGDEGPPGMGLQFENVSAMRDRQLRTLVARLQGQPTGEQVAIDPFCESGTWSPNSHSFDRDRSSGEATFGPTHPATDHRSVVVLKIALVVALLSALVLALILRFT
jgi:Tfp pilus assembly protein PilZ